MKQEEDLMQERYLVINPFPQGVFKFNVGDVLVKKGVHFCNDVKSIPEKEIVNFPNIFRPLKWWEMREEKMPKFIKLVMSGGRGYVHKVEEWKGTNSSGQPIYSYYDRAKTLTLATIIATEPATQEEYEEFRNSG